MLAHQVLTSNINKRIQQGQLVPYKSGRNDLHISHLLYADDVLIFTNGSTRSLNALMTLLHSYERSSGQLVSLEKSGYYLGSKAERHSGQITHITGISRKEFPFNYLGVPMFSGRPKIIYFEHLVEKIHKAIAGWKARVLSFGGRLTLIKSVLLSFPVYTLASSVVPQAVIHRINRLMAQFLWNIHGETRTHWVSWESVCTPIEAGGLGIRSIELIREALHAKLIWMILSSSSLWARYARSKFFRDNPAVAFASDSPLWRRLAAHYPWLLQLSKWLIGKGNVSFWNSNWVGEVLVGPLPCDERLIVVQGQQIRDELMAHIRHQFHSSVREVRVDVMNDDRLVFTLTESGAFSTKEYIKEIRDPLPKRPWAKWIWQPTLPPNIVTFLWKLFKHAIPVDCHVRTRGILMVSRCRCCRAFQEESLVHLFINSEVAREVWRCFGQIFRLPYVFSV